MIVTWEGVVCVNWRGHCAENSLESFCIAVVSRFVWYWLLSMRTDAVVTLCPLVRSW